MLKRNNTKPLVLVDADYFVKLHKTENDNTGETMRNIKTFLIVLLVALCSSSIVTAETNTVSSTVVTDKAPPTASAPSVVINNSDVCKSAYSAGVQTGFAGIATGITVTDENCERMKLSRSLFGMGMKVAAVATFVKTQECLMQ